MTLSLFLENAPHKQAVSEMRHEFGELSIGRSADVDWQLQDPEMFVSRKHCIIRADNGRYTVTDASRGGLFIDGAETPLGAGNSLQLEDGMRLRLGDFVIRVEMTQAAHATVSPPRSTTPQPPAMQADDFFSTPVERQVETPRPKDMPPPFEPPSESRVTHQVARDTRPDPGPVFDDPFTLDPLPSEPAPPVSETREAPQELDLSFDDFFGDAEPASTEPTPKATDPAGVAPPAADPPAGPPPAQAPPAAPERPAAAGPDAALAFLRGAGLDAGDLPEGVDPDEFLATMGAHFRLTIDGLRHLLHARAREKQDARIAQTIIGQTNVSPLKFAATPEEAVRGLIGPTRPGYMDAEDAINGAFRDIAEHNINSWRGVQEALRRMIDRFDPSALEKELEAVGLLEKLISGGRNAKLWQLYKERYAKIAKSAEERFLGDVGEDFRDAYERK